MSAVWFLEHNRQRRSVGDCQQFSDTCRPQSSSTGGVLSIGLLPCLGGIINDISPLNGSINTIITVTGTNLGSDKTCVNVKLSEEFECQILSLVGKTKVPSSSLNDSLCVFSLIYFLINYIKHCIMHV